MTTLVRILIGAVAGLIVGALIGRLARRKGQDQPVKADPLRAPLLGALLGALVMLMLPIGNDPTETLAEHTEQITTMQEFTSLVIDSDKPVLVKFYATWCGPCKLLAPSIAKLSQEYQGRIVFVSVDGDQAPELMRAYEVPGYPTVLIFADGKVVRRIEGYRKISIYRDALEASIEQS